MTDQAAFTMPSSSLSNVHASGAEACENMKDRTGLTAQVQHRSLARHSSPSLPRSSAGLVCCPAADSASHACESTLNCCPCLLGDDTALLGRHHGWQSPECRRLHLPVQGSLCCSPCTRLCSWQGCSRAAVSFDAVGCQGAGSLGVPMTTVLCRSCQECAQLLQSCMTAADCLPCCGRRLQVSQALRWRSCPA